MDQHTGGKWLIQGTKRHKDNQLQSLELPYRTSLQGMSTWYKGIQKWHFQSNNQGGCPGAETSRELRIRRTRTT